MMWLIAMVMLKWLQAWSDIQMKSCEMEWGCYPLIEKSALLETGEETRHLRRERNNPASQACTVTSNNIVPYRIEYKEQQQGQDDQE